MVHWFVYLFLCTKYQLAVISFPIKLELKSACSYFYMRDKKTLLNTHQTHPSQAGIKKTKWALTNHILAVYLENK